MTPKFETLQPEYSRLWATITLRQERAAGLSATAHKIIANRSRYETVASRADVPWVFVALTHQMESGLSFRGHLHNGDPLTARTVQVPKGRPVWGRAPFSWEASAADALAAYGGVVVWSIEQLCYQLERYNGWDYRVHHAAVLTPYLWSFTNHYSRGKFVRDGQWSDVAVSGQPGAMALFREMLDLDPSIADSLTEAPHERPTAAPAGESPIPSLPPPPSVQPVSRKMTIMTAYSWVLKLLGIGTGGALAADQLEATKTYARALGVPHILALAAAYPLQAVLGLIVSAVIVIETLKRLSLEDLASGRWTPSGGTE